MEIKNGKATRNKTDDWICNNEKIFKAIKYTEEQILFFATYMLAREAEYGLHNLQMRMPKERSVGGLRDQILRDTFLPMLGSNGRHNF